MDIHKPKPVHSWREFASELITVTVGVCIALALESCVESYRNATHVSFSRDDFRVELEANRTKVAQDIDTSTRLLAVLGQADHYLDALLAHQPAAAPKLDFTRTFIHLPDAAWTGALSTQVMEHFPHPEERAIAAVYSEQQTFTDFQRDAVQSWISLAAYAATGPGATDAQLTEAQHQLAISASYAASIRGIEQRLLPMYASALNSMPKH